MLLFITALFGMATGSFLNVIVHRVPEGRSVIAPRSACPHCGTQIRMVDNIPVVSWFVLRGRCRTCGGTISFRYPLVEALTGGLFVVVVLVIGVTALLPAYLWFASMTLALSLIDLDTKRLPNRVMYPGTLVAVALLAGGAFAEGETEALWRGLLAGLAYFAGLFALALAARGGFGFGDVKLAFPLGLFAGFTSWGALAVAVFGGFVFGGFASLVLLALRRAGRRDTIPFGPAMVLGAWVAVAAGDDIARWYLG